MNTNAKAIKILCYGDSNTWGWVPGKMGSERYAVNERWPGIMQSILGDKFEVIEEGLGGRMTAFDDPRPQMPLKNGLQLFPAIYETHAPIDLLILMLGTADTKEMMNLTPEQITAGLENYIAWIKQFRLVNNQTLPHILIAAPVVIKEEAQFASTIFKGGQTKGERLRELYRQLAEQNACNFIDVNTYVQPDETEGVHLTNHSHHVVAEVIAQQVEVIFSHD